MKIKSLKNALDDLGLEVTEFPHDLQRKDLYRIHIKDKVSDVVATISKKIPLRLSTNHKYFNVFQNKEALVQLLLRFSMTPIEEREDIPVYEITMKGLDEESNRLIYTKKTTKKHRKGEYFFGSASIMRGDKYYQSVFTQEDIDTFPQPFNDMVKQNHLVVQRHQFEGK